MKYQLLPLIVLLAITQPACTQVPSANVQKGVNASDDELLATLASLAKRGSSAVCNPAVIQKELGIKLGEFIIDKTPSSAGEPRESQRTRDVTVVPNGTVFKAAEYLRAKDIYGSVCSIHIDFLAERLCDTDSIRTSKIMGVAVEYGPWAQHLHIRGYSYNYKSADGVQSSVSFGSSRDVCSSKFKLTTNGVWK